MAAANTSWSNVLIMVFLSNLLTSSVVIAQGSRSKDNDPVNSTGTIKVQLSGGIKSVTKKR